MAEQIEAQDCWMTSVELANRLGVTRGYVHLLTKAKVLKPRRIGARTLVYGEADYRRAVAARDAATRGKRADLARAAGTAPDDAYVTVEEAAAILGVKSTRTVHRRIEAGELTAYRTRKSPVSLLRADVERMANGRRAA